MNQPTPSPGHAPKHGVVAVVVRSQRFLVIRRSRHVVAPGAYCFPGGAIEAGESPCQALTREMREELEAAVLPRRQLWRSLTSWNVALEWWHCDLSSARLVPNPAEVQSIHWFTADEMLELDELLESNRQFLAAIASGQIELEVRL